MCIHGIHQCRQVGKGDGGEFHLASLPAPTQQLGVGAVETPAPVNGIKLIDALLSIVCQDSLHLLLHIGVILLRGPGTVHSRCAEVISAHVCMRDGVIVSEGAALPASMCFGGHGLVRGSDTRLCMYVHPYVCDI